MADDRGGRDSMVAAQAAVLELIARGAPLPQTLEAIVRLIERDAADAPCAILRLDDDRRSLRCGAAPSLPSDVVDACCAVAAVPERIVVEDLATAPTWSDRREVAVAHGLHACWSSPILSSGHEPAGPELLGTFAMFSRVPRSPTPRELARVDAGAHLAAIAIMRDRVDQTLRRNEAQAQQLARIHAVSSSVHEAMLRERDPQALYQVACRLAVERGLALLAWVGVLDDAGDRVVPIARFGDHDGYVDAIELRQTDPRSAGGPACRAIQTGAVALSDDLAGDPGFYWKDEALRRGLRSCAAFPLRRGARTVGVLVIYGDHPGFFRAEELEVLGRLANDLSIAAEVAEHERERQRLFAELGERTAQLERLQRLYSALSLVNQAIVRVHSRDQLLADVTRALVEAGGFEMAWIGQLDPETREVVPRARFGDHAGYVEAIRVFADDRVEGRGPTGTAVREARRYVSNDFFADPHTEPWRAAASVAGWRASAAFPILRDGKAWGALSVYAREAQFFGPREEALLEEVATDVAFAIDNLEREARRHQMETALRGNQERLRMLWNLGDAMREVSDPDRVLSVVVQQLGAHLAVSRCAWAKVDPDGDRVEIPHEYLGDGAASMIGQYRLTNFGPFIAAELARGVGPVVIHDVDAELGPARGAEALSAVGIKAFVCCSLVRQGSLRAMIAVHHRTARRWTAEEVALIQEVAERSWATIEQRAAEAALRKSEALLRIAGHAARLGGWSVGPPFDRITWSDEVCAIHDVPAGTSPTTAEALAVYAPEYRDTIAQAVEACARCGTAFDQELEVITATGRRIWVRAIGQPERGADGAILRVVGAFQDVSDRHALEAQFRQAQKMEAIGQLAGGVAHDFNNLLSVILSYASLALEGLAPGDQLRADLEEIRGAGERAAALTSQLLAFSRRQLLQPRIVDLTQIVAGVQQLLRRLLGDAIELSLRRATAPCLVLADPGQLEQIVVNLAVNARDAMPTGGSLTLETSHHELDDGATRSDLPAGRYVVLAVADTGTGMDHQTQARIFEPFFTTKEKGKGTGLGLSTVYGIVTQSGGHIRVTSAPDAGTTFRVYLPRVDGPVDQTSEAPRPTRFVGTETILVVDDDDAVRAVAQSVLRRGGYLVLEAQNAGEALLICEQHAGPIDLLLTDVAMPRMSGRQLGERLAPIRPAMRVLYMSGYTDDEVIAQGARDRGVTFLAKPFTPDTLLRGVRERLDAP